MNTPELGLHSQQVVNIPELGLHSQQVVNIPELGLHSQQVVNILQIPEVRHARPAGVVIPEYQSQACTASR